MLINALIGDFGKYQLWVTFLIFLDKFGVGFHNMAIIFLAPPVKYTCEHNETCCDNPVYDTSIFKKTIITEWNLICGRSWMKVVTQALYQFGVLIGSLALGMASDRFGRRPTLILAVIVELITGVIAALVPDFWSFTVARIFLGVSVGGIMVISFVIVMEHVGNIYRDIIAPLYQVPFTVGHTLLAVFGYYIRDFTYFQLAISLSSVILLIYICLLPETPRWLLATNKTDEAANLIKKIAKINNLPDEEIEHKVQLYQMGIHSNKKGTLVDLFRMPNLRKHILIMAFAWLVCSYCFYGISQYISYLSGDIFINVLNTGGICTVGAILTIPINRFLRRRTALILTNICCGACLLCTAFIPPGPVATALALIGVLFSLMFISLLYLYSIELFPTVVRSAALGLCSMMGRIGAMIAPFVAALDEDDAWYAPVAFGVFPLITAILAIFLPETKDCELMMTLEEAEAFGDSNAQNTNPPTETV